MDTSVNVIPMRTVSNLWTRCNDYWDSSFIGALGSRLLGFGLKLWSWENAQAYGGSPVHIFYMCMCMVIAAGWGSGLFISQSVITGDHCELSYDQCADSPCHIVGTSMCEDLVSGYRCHCMNGWSGPRCSVNDDDCASSPCVEGECSDIGQVISLWHS